MREQKILVAYFSHKGENYSNGSIVNLDKGNTEIAAEMIAAHKHAELFEIESETGYPFAYRACVEVSKKELSEDARPKLKEEKSKIRFCLRYNIYWLPKLVRNNADASLDFFGEQ